MGDDHNQVIIRIFAVKFTGDDGRRYFLLLTCQMILIQFSWGTDFVYKAKNNLIVGVYGCHNVRHCRMPLQHANSKGLVTWQEQWQRTLVNIKTETVTPTFKPKPKAEPFLNPSLWAIGHGLTLALLLQGCNIAYCKPYQVRCLFKVVMQLVFLPGQHLEPFYTRLCKVEGRLIDLAW